MKMEKRYCCICGQELMEFGNNPEPYLSGKDRPDGTYNQCCSACDSAFVIPNRVNGYPANKEVHVAYIDALHNVAEFLEAGANEVLNIPDIDATHYVCTEGIRRLQAILDAKEKGIMPEFLREAMFVEPDVEEAETDIESTWDPIMNAIYEACKASAEEAFAKGMDAGAEIIEYHPDSDKMKEYKQAFWDDVKGDVLKNSRAAGKIIAETLHTHGMV